VEEKCRRGIKEEKREPSAAAGLPDWTIRRPRERESIIKIISNARRNAGGKNAAEDKSRVFSLSLSFALWR